MLNPKPLCILIIVLILLVGIYEKQTGNVVSVTHHWGKRSSPGHYKMVSGNLLIYFSLFLAVIASYIFRKD